MIQSRAGVTCGQMSVTGSNPVSVTSAGVNNCLCSGVIRGPLSRADAIPDTVPKPECKQDSVLDPSASAA